MGQIPGRRRGEKRWCVRDELDGLGEAENKRRELGTGISFSRGGSQEQRKRV